MEAAIRGQCKSDTDQESFAGLNFFDLTECLYTQVSFSAARTGEEAALAAVVALDDIGAIQGSTFTLESDREQYERRIQRCVFVILRYLVASGSKLPKEVLEHCTPEPTDPLAAMAKFVERGDFLHGEAPRGR
jgi:hypothetical protein